VIGLAWLLDAKELSLTTELFSPIPVTKIGRYVNSTVSVELPVPVVTTICFAPTVLEPRGLTGVTNVRLVDVMFEGVTSTPSILTVVAVPVGSKFDPDTVTVVPPAAVPEVGEIEVIEGGTDACEIETNPPDKRRAEIRKATARGYFGLERACFAKTIPLSNNPVGLITYKCKFT
jgi:hypothetical protein